MTPSHTHGLCCGCTHDSPITLLSAPLILLCFVHEQILNVSIRDFGKYRRLFRTLERVRIIQETQSISFVWRNMALKNSSRGTHREEAGSGFFRSTW